VTASAPAGLPAPRGTPYRIGFVCLGNICRSPMADVILTELVDLGGLTGKVEVTSCGTGDWHVGHPMDPRAATALLAEGYDPSAHRAQQFDPSWLEQDLLLAMDAQNLNDVLRDASSLGSSGTVSGAGESERVRLFRSFDPLLPDPTDSTGPVDRDVPDPYYGGDDGFAEVVSIVERTCRRLLQDLEALEL
jgi:protein-tyrosine phosphatase